MAYEDTVRESLSLLDNEEIAARIRSGGMTEEAQQVAKKILAERGGNISADDVPAALSPDKAITQEEKAVAKPKESDSAFLSRCFHGKAKLSDAFWVLWIAIAIVIVLPFAVLSGVLKGTAFGPVVSVLGAVVLFGALVFRDISIWRCAPNAPVLWGVVARIWIGVSYAFLLAVFLFRK